MIPHQNVGDLLLRKDVIKAVEGKKFYIYSIKTVDEGIELLSGLPAGEKKADWSYAEGTVNYFVDKKLQALAEGLKKFASEEKETPSPKGDKRKKGNSNN
jgi:ATP-dependent Lon protease